MLQFLSENRASVLAMLLLVFFLLLLSAQVRMPGAADGVQDALLTVLSPVARGGSESVRGASSLWERYVALQGIQEENRRLRREVERLRLDQGRLQEAARENRRLADLLQLQQGVTLPTVAARVIQLELDAPFRVAVLDRGSAHRIARHDAVITTEGVVGRVVTVSPWVAKVQLIVDPSSGAAAMVERTRVQGMAVGRGVNRLELQYVAALSDVAPGDAIDTSGLDGIYPKGLRIGLVDEVDDGPGLQRRVQVETSVDFRTLEEVLVLVGDHAEEGG